MTGTEPKWVDLYGVDPDFSTDDDLAALRAKVYSHWTLAPHPVRLPRWRAGIYRAACAVEHRASLIAERARTVRP